MIAIRTSRRRSPLEIWRNVDRRKPANVEYCRSQGVRSLWLTPPWLRGTSHHYDLMGLSHGTLTNMDPATSWLNGPSGPFLSFNGSNNTVLMSPPVLVAPLTITARVMFPSLAATKIVAWLGWQGQSAWTAFYIAVQTTGEVRAVAANNNSFAVASSSAGAISAGVEYTLSAVFYSSTSRKIFVNGVEVGSNTTTVTPSTITQLRLGSDGVSTSGIFSLMQCRSLMIHGTAIAAPDRLHEQTVYGFPAYLNVRSRRMTSLPPSAPSEITGTASITEADDSAELTGNVRVAGSIAVSENDSATASGGVLVAGSTAPTEADDGVSCLASALVTGACGIAEQSDLAAAIGSVLVTGTSTIAEADDVVVARSGGATSRSIFRARNFRPSNFSRL